MHEEPVQSTATSPASDDPLIGTIIGDRYRVEAELGSGGMGTVYRAEHVMMEKRVALKVLHPNLAVVGSVMDRFQREAVALSRIEHPNVVAATDFGKLKNGSYYLALEYVDGHNLAETLQVEGLLDLRRTLHISHQIAEALDAAHGHGIVHRDLKPHNVMLSGGAGSEIVKVLDFGLAKLRSKTIEGSTANIGSVFGTPHYMAPEQVATTNVDARADLYSLGIMMYEMLTGRRPFDADSPALVLDLQMSAPPPPLPEHLPDSVRELVSELMQKLPDGRPASALLVAQRIDGILHPKAPEEPQGWSPVDWVMQDLNLGSLRFPRWALLLPGAVFLLIWVLGLVVSPKSDESQITASVLPESTPSAAQPAAASAAMPEASRLPQLISQAEFGDQAALTELRAIAIEKRERDIWVVIAQGLTKAGQPVEAVKELGAAVHAKGDLKLDEGVTAIVRELASSENSSAALEALTLAATELGARGIDILFSVWSETKLRTPATALAERYLGDQEVLKNASKAVHVALELRKDELSCDEAKALLERAKTSGDTRSLRPMAKFRKLRGCGAKKRSDCFPCLREGELLEEAIREANSRPAPRY
jgi:serine/threonine-protein kinase